MKSYGKTYILFIALALVSAGCVNRETQAQTKRTSELVADPKKPVSVVKITRRNIGQYIHITGQLATDSDTSVGPKIGGKLVSINVRSGDSVAAGQLLGQVDTTNLTISVSQARAQLDSALAGLTQAQTNARIVPTRSSSAVRAAEAQLRQARTQLEKALNGARPEEKAQADAAVRSAKSNMETAKKNRDRQSNLFAEGASSRQQLDAAENAYQASLAQYEQALASQQLVNNATRTEDIQAAREAVRQAEEGVRTAQTNKQLDSLLGDQVRSAMGQVESARAQYRLAVQQIEDAQIRSPFSGKVLGTPVQPGTVVSPGTPVVRLIGAKGLYFEGDVPASAVSSLAKGSPVSVTVDGLDGHNFIGTIDSLSPAATNVGRVFQARITFPSFDETLRAGMFARGKIKIKEATGVLTVPALAIVKRGSEQFIYIVDGTKAKEVKVTRGFEEDGMVQVTGGFAEGNDVIVEGANDVADGSIIDIKPREQNDTKQSKRGASPWA